MEVLAGVTPETPNLVHLHNFSFDTRFLFDALFTFDALVSDALVSDALACCLFTFLSPTFGS